MNGWRSRFLWKIKDLRIILALGPVAARQGLAKKGPVLSDKGRRQVLVGFEAVIKAA
jgi:hypothetical protein